MDVSTPQRLEERQRLADAVAVAGLEAAATRAPRAVVLVLGPKPADESVLSPEQARAFLEALRVPLFVWSVRAPDGTGWEITHEASRSGSFLRAVVQLREAVMGQRILWLEGMHLIGRVSLSDQADGLTLLR
jgi:hypothetical protein